MTQFLQQMDATGGKGTGVVLNAKAVRGKSTTCKVGFLFGT